MLCKLLCSIILWHSELNGSTLCVYMKYNINERNIAIHYANMTTRELNIQEDNV